MTQEQRKHIEDTIAILDMASALMIHAKYFGAAVVVSVQGKILQKVLDDDRRGL